jgi:hypothetical protein
MLQILLDLVLTKEVARYSPRGLICPITLKDTPFRELCVGHILNQGLQHASRLTVPQRRDLDNFFGASIEADLVRYLNFPILSSAEHLAKVKRFTIRLPTGDRMEAFFAGDEAAKRFKRVDITNAQGELVASPYVRSNESMVGEYKDVEVEWEITINDLALVGALIKSAYLTLFRLVGYRYALDPIGSIVRKSLGDFFNDRADKTSARQYFARFKGAVITSLKGLLNTTPDTLSGGTLLFHYDDGTNHDTLFAVSCLFHINKGTLIVTLPAVMDVTYSIVALQLYERLLKDRGMRNDIHFVTFDDEKFEVSPVPMDLRYLKSPTTDSLQEA